MGLLPSHRLPTTREILALPYYDQQVAGDHGKFFLMGRDEQENDVYIIGKHNLSKQFEKIIRQVSALFDLPQDEFMIIDTMPYVNVTMMIGGYTSRRLGCPRIGRPIVVQGTKKAFWKLVSVVNRIQVMSKK